MTTIKLVLIALFIALTFACSHPIEIVGNGDVLSATGTRNCYLEDFQAKRKNCTENIIAEAYLETYYAIPRSGWKFERWENYCTDGSTVDECSFNVSAEAVKNFEGETAPPLVAVFTPNIGASGTASDLGFDDFESGQWNTNSVKFSWVAPTIDDQGSAVYVQNGMGVGGGHALMLKYAPESPIYDGALAELWFTLDQYYPELTIEFDYYVPSNFVAENLYSVQMGIGKLFRIYGDSYNDALKVGINANINPQFISGMDDIIFASPSYMVGVGPGHGSQGNAWGDPRAYMLNQITEKGRWFHIRYYIKAPTANSNSIQRLTINGKTVEYSRDTYHKDNPRGYKVGYIGGNSSNGYRTTTTMRIDNVRIRAGDR